jgi:glyoxylase-like metal-dependent hydrolase (beta-lactamase superfamily II)
MEPAFTVTDVITDLGHDVFQIDTRMAGYDGITAGYLIRGERPCLVETGAAPSAPLVRDALAALGIGPADLATVVVTHIHLDHAGGTGDIARMFPAAELVVHELGARHLADPSRLMSSARRVYGDELDSHYSPGHARHHVGLVDSHSGDLYVGDAAGVYVQETGDMRPATPPPDFDLRVALESLRLFAALQPARLLFSHFGPVTDIEETLDRSAAEINLWVAETRRARGAGMDADHAAAMVAERTRQRYAALAPGADPEIMAKVERVSGAAANVAGILHWLDRANQG